MTADIKNFATASGGNVASDLNFTGAVFIRNVIDGRFEYAEIKYFTADDLAGVLPGHKLTVSEFEHANNNGTNMHILDVLPDGLIVRMVERTSALEDETGVEVTGDVTTSGAEIKPFSIAKNALGAALGEKWSAGNQNFVIRSQQDIINAQDEKITELTARSASVYAGMSIVSSPTYSYMTGGGFNWVFSGISSDQLWSASMNDGAFESFAGINIDLTTSSNNKVFHFFTYEQASGMSRPVEPRLQINGSTVHTIQSNVSGHATETQAQCAFSYPFLYSSPAGAAYDFDVQALRYTGLSASKARAWAFELQKDYIATLTTGITQGTLATGPAVDLAGYSITQTFTQSKALVLIGSPTINSSNGSPVNPGYMLTKAGVTQASWYMPSSPSTAQTAGTMIAFNRMVDVSGSTNLKLQGNCLQNTQYFSAGNGGYFGVIELPNAFNGDTLMRHFSADISSFSNTTYAEQATTGAVTTNGHPVVLMLSGMIIQSNRTVSAQFQIDGVDEGAEYQFTHVGGGVVNIMIAAEVPAGTHTFRVLMKVSNAFAMTPYGLQFAAFEMPSGSIGSGDEPTIELINTTGKKVELQYTGSVTADANSVFSIQAMQDGVAAGNPFSFDATASKSLPFAFRTVIDGPDAGNDPVYQLQAKTSSGSVIVNPGDFTAREIPGS